MKSSNGTGCRWLKLCVLGVTVGTLVLSLGSHATMAVDGDDAPSLTVGEVMQASPEIQASKADVTPSPFASAQKSAESKRALEVKPAPASSLSTADGQSSGGLFASERPSRPGSGEGSGSRTTDDCQVDDGTTENALGVTTGGEMAWIQECVAGGTPETVVAVSTVWGNTGGTPGVNAGDTVRVYVWIDPTQDGNPCDAVLACQTSTTADAASIGTDVFQKIPLDCPVNVAAGESYFIGASAVNPAGGYPAPMDESSSAGVSWLGYVVGGVYDPNVIGGDEPCPLNMSMIGYQSNWLLRANTVGVSIPTNLDCQGCDPLSPIPDPTAFPWHELYPNFCQPWQANEWRDNPGGNPDGFLSVCDYIGFKTAGGPQNWWHVERVTITIWITEKVPPFEQFAFDWDPDNSGDDPMFNPYGTWHEIWPVYCNLYNTLEWMDSDMSGHLSPSDQIIFHDKQTQEIRAYHIDIVSVDIDVIKQFPPATCGDGVCEGDEDCCNCPQDCGGCTCGDGICDDCGEDCATCPQDCGDCSGACCDDASGVCTDDVPQVDCPAPLRFAANTQCADLVPPCGDTGCPGKTMTIEILTDAWGSETTWQLLHKDTNTVVATGGPYPNNTLIIVDVCLELQPNCYNFTIFDSFGDGIFAPGYYRVYHDGILACSGGDFGGSETCSDLGGECDQEQWGACCDHSLGYCIGEMLESDCYAIAEQPEFFKDMTCADVEAAGLCWEHEGACCDHATAMCLGWMTESACMAIPPPAQPEWFKDITCSDPGFDCWEHMGACCDHATATCMGWMTESACMAIPPPAQPEFFKDITCNDAGFDCWEHTGACCDHWDGLCLDGIPESMCPAIAIQPEWFKDQLCADVNCDQHTGACCYTRRGRWTCRVTDKPACANLPDSWFLGHDTECPKGSKAKHKGVAITHYSRSSKACKPGGRGERTGPCLPGDPIDPWATDPEENTCHQFNAGPTSPPIPADFFGPGSDPFEGQVCLEGVPLPDVFFPPDPNPYDFGDADTLVRRSADPFDRCELPSENAVTVEVEVVALSLKSIDPITITSNGGQDPTQWDVTVGLSAVTPPPGSITAVKTHCNGGTYTSVLHISPKFTFTEVGNPSNVQVLDTGLEGIEYVTLVQPDPDDPQESDPLWTHDLPEDEEWGSPICSDFHPSVEDPEPTTACDCNCNGVRDKCDIEQGAPDGNANGVPDECEGICVDNSDCCDDGDECTTHECQNPPNGTCVTTYTCNDECDCFACDDDNVCTKDDCSGANCAGHCQIMFGDANDNGVVNTADVLACNGAIPGGLCAMPTCDVNPICTGNGVLNTADVLTINGSIGGPDPCNCPARNCP